jgi:diguanylate cyclase (GGDEF)-like protein
VEIEHRLSDVLSEFARTLVTDFPIQAILDHLVLRIVDVLPVSAAGVTLISPGSDPRYIAASDASALRFEQLQTELGEGPCLVAYETGESVSVPDLRNEMRFPAFVARARVAGLVAVFSFPLRHGDHQLGALDVYRTTTGQMDEPAMAAAQTLADVASAYLLNAQARVDLKESSERARQTSLHDALTGLANRTLLVQRLEHAMLRCRRSEKMVAILFADLDRFKAVNDTYGHHVGDELLVAVGARLTGLLRPGDTLARLAGDEFVILCEDLDDAMQVEPLAARIGSALTDPFALSTVAVRVSASVGIAFAGRGDNVPEQVLQDADTAMYQVKRSGGARHGVVDLREQSIDTRRADLSRDLRDALARGQLRTEYQPIVAMADGQLTGVEALLRWSHPDLGMVGPETAVPLAEQTGLISEIGRWMLEQACLDRKGWAVRHQSQRRLDVAVNVSAHQLMGPDFAGTVEGVLTGTGTAADLVTLEVTESVFLQDSARALIVLHSLKDLGVRLALDDFGTGYSSLSYLKQFPVDIVKIDQSFVADLGHDATSRHIVNAIVGLGHDLGMTIVAEGVESPTQYEEVLALGCDAYQGYYFSRPQPPEDLEAFLVDGQAVEAAR